MMSPTRTTVVAPLFEEARRLSTLLAAWRHVQSRARKSSDPDTKRERASIEADELTYLRRLQRELGANRFEFEKQKAVLKRRTGKDPRPIVVAPLRNRIVQRAILDVLQRPERRLQRQCGTLREALFTPTSVGGLPERGVPRAIELIQDSIAAGATYYVRSDLKAFFANIPKDSLFEFLDREIQDEAFVTLFKAALETDFSNADDQEIRRWWELFPDDDKGVPQGSALSALSANIVLAKFDEELNRNGIRTVRYLDDFLILAPSKESAEIAWQRGISILAALGLDAHLPGQSDKAAAGSISEGLEFLSLRFRGRTVAPTKAAKTKLLADIEKELASARRVIKRTAGDLRRREARFVQTLADIDSKVRGWGDAFRPTTQRLEFAQLDEQISAKIDGFVGWFLRIQQAHSQVARRRMWGVALLTDTPRPDDTLIPKVPLPFTAPLT